VKLLLDTHCFLWLNSEPTRVSPTALAACLDAANPLHLSLISLWEIQIKQQLGKLKLREPWSKRALTLSCATRATDGLPSLRLGG